MTKKISLLFTLMLSTLMASAHDIEVKNADGKTIYYNYINNGTELEVSSRGSSYDFYPNEHQGNVVIPEEVTYMNRTRKVTSIGDNAFQYCSGLTSVTIPNSVTSIGEGAFWYCSGLTSITIPNSVTSIGNHAFNGCSKLTSITIPNSVTSIGEFAFHNCSGLTSITIPNSVTSIGNWAFSGCSGLTSVTIPNSVTSIGISAFEDCSKLTSVTITDIAAWCKISFSNYNANPLSYAKHLFMDGKEIIDLVIPNSVTSIGNHAFNDCSGLTSVTIPNSVTSIGISAFEDCSKLTSVTIGNSVTSIGQRAFDGADIPTVVSLIENPFKITGKTSDSRTFTQNTFNNATLYVPKGTIEKYKATDGWKDFLFIEEGEGHGGDTPEPPIPEPQKCATPTISIADGKIKYDCETEGAELHYEYSFPQGSKGVGSKSEMPQTIIVSVYATKSGYEDSDVATKEIEVSGGSTAKKGDVNEDGIVNGTDIQEIINIIVEGE